ncbi:geranylgeranyl transferase type-2 subunit alpha 1-like [Chenopodium quinoa]|uniref:Geranylgeranyl transferase type-2 subunit alpha n=1 Tax=Chenopodium quinoa TaxID=63459 RepID=A0A803NA82_CHEQI|nr:geranylgeranyl transferase type-2 subunit alpha 1-like [Chenopodium quinoa]XP_021776372.1 geranylgeranyl transferase type-2 subunit alpha 1-like [Chenopodium quinoa]
MHGRPRNPSKPEDEAASAAKASKLRALQSQFLNYHHSRNFDKEAVEISAKLLETNPEFYTAWNYRKLAVEYFLSQPGSDPESILNEELRVVESALRQNFKSYGAWHHRKWVLSKGHSSVDNELRLLDKFQKADARNFHAWNYRRFVAALKNIADEDELEYTTNMIETNFSNYSAWHNRSVLLSNLLKQKAEGYFPKEKILAEEYDLVHQAIFTDSDDQSGWFNHLWLLEQTITKDTPWLNSSWPASDSELIISASKSASGCMVSSSARYSTDGGTIPVILYFNQSVRGVNSSTVAVRSSLAESKDIIWRPLSVDKYESAQAWVALLNFSDVPLDYSIAYPVEVRVGDSSEIISLSGSSLSHVFEFKFVVRFQQHDSGEADGQNLEVILWEDSNFQKYEMDSGESNLFSLFNQLQIDADQAGVDSKWKVNILANEIELFRELSAADCKIGKLTLARLLTALDKIVSESSTLNSSQMVHTEEVMALYCDLMKMDPPHSKYYKEEHSMALLRQVTCCKDSLSRYCWHYGKIAKTNNESFICVRLNSLSLARIGSIENLLWVQMLDLSQNELGSVEGLEAMQLLSCLNLSNNKIKSFTALDPLRHLKLLKVLNISHNKIGEHSIDSTRYLCSSSLSHTVANDWKLGLSSGDVDQLTKYWEAYIIFRDLTLTQLEITGNAIVDEDFRSFLRKILSTLEWLDGTIL